MCQKELTFLSGGKMSDISYLQSVSDVFKKAGFKVVPTKTVTLSPEQIKRQQEVTDAVNKYIKTLQQAHKASENSTLVFKAQHQPKQINPLNIQRQR